MPGLLLALLLAIVVYLASASVLWAVVAFVLVLVLLDARFGVRRWY